MRYQRTFEWAEDQSTGEWGWIPEWLDGVDDPYAFIGDGVAHDALEHEAHESDGDLENETRALGAVYFVRGESGWFGSRNRGNASPDENIASDFIDLYRAFAYAGDSIGDETPTAATDPHGMAPTFRHIVRAGIRQAIAEHAEDTDDRAGLAEFARGREWFAHLLCEGYAKAHERFEGKSWAARELFERIADASTEAAKHAQDMQTGRLILDIDTRAGKFHATCEIYENPTFGDDMSS